MLDHRTFVTEDIEAGVPVVIYGTRGDDHFVGTDDADYYRISQGGADTVETFGGYDEIALGRRLTARDQIDGGDGYDTVYVQCRAGYKDGLVIGNNTLAYVETISFGFLEQATFTFIMPAHMQTQNSSFRAELKDAFGDVSLTDATFDASQAQDYGVQLVADGGDDHLIGGLLNDYLIGGLGSDVQTGGAGINQFAFNSTDTSLPVNPDVITDFTLKDVIVFSGLDGDTDAPGLQSLHFGETSQHTGDVTVAYDQAADRTSVNVFTGTDTLPDLTIWLTGNHSDITAANFYLPQYAPGPEVFVVLHPVLEQSVSHVVLA